MCYVCPFCNGHKWAFETGTDPETEEIVPLFHPRQQVWTDHFRWSEASEAKTEGITPCGRATIERLKLNDPEVVSIRQVLMDLGIRFRHRK